MTLLARLQALPLAFAMLLCASASCQSFTNPLRIATPVDPDAVLSGDLNGDGRPDLIWLQVTSSNTVGHIVLAQASGGYLAGQTFMLPGAPTGVPNCLIADVTRDGKPDVLCAALYSSTSSVTVFVFPGNGDGTLGAPVSSQFTSQLGPSIYFVPVGDLNGDGVPDFILENIYYTPALVLLSDGKGGFLPPKTVANSYNYSVPVAVDINGDGIPDILWPEGAAVALGKGDGSFGNLTSPYSTASGPRTCVFHDMDGDGKLDAVCGYLESGVMGTALDILHGNGDGTFNPSPISHTTFGSASISRTGTGVLLMPEVVADVNGDGIPDVLAFGGDGLTVLLGQPGLTFAPPAEYAVGYSGFSPFLGAWVQRKYADLNGDGSLDVLTAGPNGMYVLYGRANGTFSSALTTRTSEETGRTAVADFNGDGKPDLVSTGEPQPTLSLGKGDGTFSAPVPILGAPFAYNQPILVADFNGDGKPDLLSADSSSNHYLMLGRGDGSFGTAIATSGLPAALTPSSSTVSYTAGYALTADMNGDGKADLFFFDTDPQSPTYRLVSALSAGDGTFRTVSTSYPAPVYVSGIFYYTPAAAVLGDFAHRGQLDAAYYINEKIYVAHGHGDGSFDAALTVLATPTVAGAQPVYQQAMQVGDFDGDGKLDLAFLSWYTPGGTYFYQTGPSCVFIYYGNGDGTFQSPVQAGCFVHAYSDFRVADINGDGRPDIILQTASSLNEFVVGTITNLGGRLFGPEVNYTAGSLSGDFYVADFNGDGRPDLLFGNQRYEAGYGADSVTVLLNNGPQTATGILTSSPDPSYIGQSFTLTAALTPPVPGTVYTGTITFYVDGNSIGVVPLSGNTATITNPLALGAGTHQLLAIWSGDVYNAALTFGASHTVLQLPLQVALTCSPDPSIAGKTVTLAAQLTATPPPGLAVSSAPFMGTLSFYEGATLLGQQQVAGAGFSLNTTTLTVGTHSIMASYAADSVYASGSGSCSEVVTALPTVSALSVSPTSTTFGSPVKLTATVSPATPPGAGTPTGTVSFYNGSSSLVAATLVNGVASTTLSTLPSGTYALTCTYNGSSVYGGSSCNTVPVTVAPAASALTLTSSLNPAPALTSITFTAHLTTNSQPAPAGNIIVLSLNGQTISLTTDATGSASYSLSTLTPGSYPVNASFAATSNLLASTASLTEVVNALATTTSLTAAPNPAYFGQVVTLTASVAANGSAVTTGMVTFFDGTVMLGQQPLSTTASYTTSAFAVGTHPITAVYTPAGSVFLASSSSLVSEVVLASGFTLTLSPATVSIAPGAGTSVAIQLGSVGAFSGPLALTYGTLPAYATASITPPAITLAAGGAGASAITINTLLRAQSTAPLKPGSRQGPALMAACLLSLLPLSFTRRRQFARMLRGAVLLVALLPLTGCTNSWYSANTVAAGTYQLPVTATDVHGNSQSATLTVVVTP